MTSIPVYSIPSSSIYMTIIYNYIISFISSSLFIYHLKVEYIDSGSKYGCKWFFCKGCIFIYDPWTSNVCEIVISIKTNGCKTIDSFGSSIFWSLIWYRLICIKPICFINPCCYTIIIRRFICWVAISISI